MGEARLGFVVRNFILFSLLLALILLAPFFSTALLILVAALHEQNIVIKTCQHRDYVQGRQGQGEQRNENAMHGHFLLLLLTTNYYF